jgi:hypothetical protein
MKDQLTKSEIRDRKKKFPKTHAREIQKKNKEAFDKSYFGIILKERNL